MIYLFIFRCAITGGMTAVLSYSNQDEACHAFESSRCSSLSTWSLDLKTNKTEKIFCNDGEKYKEQAIREVESEMCKKAEDDQTRRIFCH